MNKYTRSFTLAIVMLISPPSAEASVFSVLNNNDSGSGSLRQAIIDANADSAAPHTIQFAIPGSGPHTINVLSQFPGIDRSMTIDGYSQAGSAMNTNTPEQGGLNAHLKIEVVGPGNVYFIYLNANNGLDLTVQGLAIRGFQIAVLGVGGNGEGGCTGKQADGEKLDAWGHDGHPFVQVNLQADQNSARRPTLAVQRS